MIEVQDLIAERYVQSASSLCVSSPVCRGGDPKKVKDSLQKRYTKTEIVDEVIALWQDAYQSQSTLPHAKFAH